MCKINSFQIIKRALFVLSLCLLICIGVIISDGLTLKAEINADAATARIIIKNENKSLKRDVLAKVTDAIVLKWSFGETEATSSSNVI